MHKDVAKALEAATKRYKEWSGETEGAANATTQILQAFHRNLPNSTDTANGLALWYPTRILVELTEEKEHGG